MGFDAFTKEQLKNALLAASLAVSQSSNILDSEEQAFRAGFMGALSVIATNFGIDLFDEEIRYPRRFKSVVQARLIPPDDEKG